MGKLGYHVTRTSLFIQVTQ